MRERGWRKRKLCQEFFAWLKLMKGIEMVQKSMEGGVKEGEGG